MNPRSPYGWMVLGGLLCLFGVVAVVKWRDGSQAHAQSTTTPLPPISDANKVPSLPPVGAEVLSSPAPVPAPPSADVKVPPPSPKLEVAPPIVVPPPETKGAPPPQPPLGSEPRPIHIPPSVTQGATPPPPVLEVNHVAPPPAKAVDAPPPPPPAPGNRLDIPPPVTPVKGEPAKDHVNEPPLAPAPGPVITYRLSKSGETFRSLARKTLNNPDRWNEIHKLNPNVKADAVLVAGTVVRLPADACVGDEDGAIRQLPSMRPRPAPKPRAAFPLTGTFPLTLDDKRGLTLPRAILSQLGDCDTVLLSPGSDRCLWLTNQTHLDRMAAKLEKSPAREADVQSFKRLYYAQTLKTPVREGRVVISDRLAQFAGLHQELVLVGVDDHFEVWDAARWRHYVHAKRSKEE